jgi:hypothetical protein
MKSKLTKKQKEDKSIVDLVNQMFIIAGHNVSYEDVLGVEDWFMKYTMTVEQGEEFKEWGKNYLIKNLKMQNSKAEKEMMWFSVQWGLAYSNLKDYEKK